MGQVSLEDVAKPLEIRVGVEDLECEIPVRDALLSAEILSADVYETIL